MFSGFRRLVAVAVLTLPLSLIAAEGMVVVKSSYSAEATADKLETVLRDKGMTVMNRINHAEGADKAGLELRPTEVVIFGNPRVGTPLMQCAQSVAIDLPQKALIWEDSEGQVWLGYNDPEYLRQRHDIEGCDEAIGKVEGALAGFAKAATE
ncbi:hypothetical protein DIT71_05895 [Marinobacter vulgaris]|uniref:DUF302 domain-containing protein n=1 Tax=Marinobacter vulgaris TaxID=1928331 RepID=A0A2V3ZNM7_9GAMM|nr:DUF302 domain-containing protein [Marinobacter vulgaris]PXX92708.1 hypothetical protein DIT71_05895 [Marinobacter vulgaris]TSJ71343.1 DUF302 domain-containing protein [Marinobacter vulgaris]